MSTSRVLGIIVVNYASSHLLEVNLAATAAAVPDARIIVVDNLSSPAERERVGTLCEEHGWHLVAMPDNAGFGGGVNAGAALAFDELGATDILLLNPDAHIDSRSTSALASATADGMTLASPRVEDADGRTWFAGMDVYLDDGSMGGPRRRREQPDARRLPWLSGACLWVPRALWERVGGFHHDYFLYWEDVDISVRASRAGARLLVVEEAIAVHDEGATHRSTSQRPEAKSALYYYYNIRNRLLFAALLLDRADADAWSRTAFRNAWQVLLRGGRRQFLHPIAPLRAAWRGVRDGRRLMSDALSQRNASV
ncbi:glycosyltransferase family 2 protein [Microbacterium saperdae]|uniref:GT2 family glycosyltransferase n=1 Tax=Microbacterium saperdae TaxID=69368 RepID=A0A543BC24_9MICO|nr:glycosyltransferase family 2 protein [Microbacterium saperdae]TQL82405.1 GT2 family glycosyltransferase [Microbacterium saperdae]